MIYRPSYVDKIMAYVDTPFVKILTGVRRCGKSTILKMIMSKLRERGIPESRIVSYCFDSMEYEDMTAKQMYSELKSRVSPEGKTYFFLDEMQEIKGWEKVVNSLSSDYDVDLYITGMSPSGYTRYPLQNILLSKSSTPLLVILDRSLPTISVLAVSPRRICKITRRTKFIPSSETFTILRFSLIL